MLDTLLNFIDSTGVAQLVRDPAKLGMTLIMYLIVILLLYLAIKK